MITMRNGTKYYRENELSKLGYIKKEELKEKINLLKSIQLKTSTHPKIKWLDKKEILELIDK